MVARAAAISAQHDLTVVAAGVTRLSPVPT